MRLNTLFLISAIGLAGTVSGACYAQQSIALKSGESTDLGPIYWVAQCRSIVLGIPDVEILEGPPGLTLSIREGMVLPRKQNCPTEVPGGILVAKAGEVKDRVQGRLIYRIKYKTKDGDRQLSNTYNVSLFP